MKVIVGYMPLSATRNLCHLLIRGSRIGIELSIQVVGARICHQSSPVVPETRLT